MSSVETLVGHAARLGVPLTERDAARLLKLLEELERWNRAYNLTAIGAQDAVTRHLLDSLAVQPELQGDSIADVGTGAGFPGLPLAVVNPQRRFTLIDSSGKKVRFVAHAAHTLGLQNVEAVQARVESFRPPAPYDTIIARAFAALPDLLSKVAALCGPNSRVLAMKGKWPESELQSLPAGWRVDSSRRIHLPGLDEERCVIVLRPRPPEESRPLSPPPGKSGHD